MLIKPVKLKNNIKCDRDSKNIVNYLNSHYKICRRHSSKIECYRQFPKFPNVAVISDLFKKSVLINQVLTFLRKLMTMMFSDVCFQTFDILMFIVIDICFGIMLSVLTSQSYSSEEVYNFFILFIENICKQLENLIDWLMGIPAGFKLNAPLTAALGTFFLYHIYLWNNYIMLIKPIMHFALNAFFISGYLGLSFQLAVIADLLSFATMHIYCFYIYALRLYKLEIEGLKSLWRLFRGKKYNPLRKRADSAVYNIDQLFIGTLLFTVLLFFFPTILIYYIVFTFLRLGKLMCDAILLKFLTIWNRVAPYTYFVWMFGKHYLPDGYKFIIKQVNDGWFLEVQCKSPSLEELINQSLAYNSQLFFMSFQDLLANVIYGQRIELMYL